MSSKLQLVLADDHHILLDGLRSLLSRQKDMEVTGTYENGRLLFDALASLPETDLAIVDINMPVMDGRELTVKMKEHYPHIPVIVLSMHDDAAHIMDMVEAGICGYLLKNANDAELLEAIRTVVRGRMYFSAEVADKIEALVKQRQRVKETIAEAHLTERELEILRLITQDFSNAEIGQQLYISERTVETHRKNMMRKTGNKSIVGLLKYAMELGMG